MDMIGRIRRLHSRGNKSEREISRMTGLSRNTVAKWLHGEVDGPPKYRRQAQPNKLTPFHETLKQALKADARRPRQERRTAKALYAHIKAEGYSGGYTRVTDFIRAWRLGEGQGAAVKRSCRWPSSWARRSSSTGARKAWWSAAFTTAPRSRT
jgi:transposase